MKELLPHQLRRALGYETKSLLFHQYLSLFNQADIKVKDKYLLNMRDGRLFGMTASHHKKVNTSSKQRLQNSSVFSPYFAFTGSAENTSIIEPSLLNCLIEKIENDLKKSVDVVGQMIITGKNKAIVELNMEGKECILKIPFEAVGQKGEQNNNLLLKKINQIENITFNVPKVMSKVRSMVSHTS